MNNSSRIDNQFEMVKKHLYISPLEACNLSCRICYTNKVAPKLSNDQVIKFIDKYRLVVPNLETVTFCGGEVMAVPEFPSLVNNVANKGIFSQIVTNGTIDRLEEFENPNEVNLIVSIDGMKVWHEKNRGEGNWQKSVNLLNKALTLGFHGEIFSIVHQGNINEIETFKKEIEDKLIKRVDITYHPRKPVKYLSSHPVNNLGDRSEDFGFLEELQWLKLWQGKKVFPPKNLGCYQVALMSNGQIYGCCEGIEPVGKIDDDIGLVLQKMRARVEKSLEYYDSSCLGCVEGEFGCGIRDLVNLQIKSDN